MALENNFTYTIIDVEAIVESHNELTSTEEFSVLEILVAVVLGL